MSSGSSSLLRWARYDGVYYAALLVPAAEAPVDVPDGHTFVFFLDGESGAVLSNEDVEPYNPDDTAKSTHPEAVAGVEIAAQILYGSADSGTQQQETVESEDNLLLLDSEEPSPGKRDKKKEKNAKRERNHREERLINEKEDTELLADDSVRHRVAGKKKAKRGRSQECDVGDGPHTVEGIYDPDAGWAEMTEEYDLGGETTPSPRRPGATRGRTGRRTGADVGSPSVTQGMASTLTAHGSPVQQYLAEIRYAYQKAWSDAMAKNMLLPLQEVDVVRSVERQLKALLGKVAHIDYLLEHMDETLGQFPSACVKENDAMKERQALRALRNRLQRSVNVTADVESIVKLYPSPSRETTRYTRHLHSLRSVFCDASMTFLYAKTTLVAAPRELTHDLANKYRDQRMRRERVLASHKGLGKTGLYAAPKTMESWRRGRELMVLAPAQENQPVLPAGYISRRYATAISKVENYALKRASIGGDFSQYAKNPYATQHSLALYGSQDLLSTFQSNTRRSRQIIPAYYNFHDLQNDQQGENGVVYRPPVGTGLLTAFSEEPTPLPDGAPIISPMHIGFDPHTAFNIAHDEIKEEQSLAAALAAKSMVYSQSIPIPSQESQWYSEMYRVPSTGMEEGQRTAQASRATSRYSSAAYTKDANDGTVSGRRRGREKADKKLTWRDAAKRAILEQLTLYLRGLRGCPTVLKESDFEDVARKLLDRAVRAESERTGISMSLQANNAAVPLTKKTEMQLKHSVDSYIQRHFVASEIHSSIPGTSASYSGAPGQVNLPQPPTVVSHGVDDSPVYDQ